MDISSREDSMLSDDCYLDKTKCIKFEGDKTENIDLKIIEWFEQKKCPFFLASDGGNLNKKEHGIDRGVSSVVLGAPYMGNDEDFNSIMDHWMERDPLIFIVRTSILPVWIGDTHTSNVQTEASGFCNLATMLYTNPPQISILDSNATVFSARNIRDEPNIPIRRQIRGTGVAAGKSFSGRMRRIFQAWDLHDNESIRGSQNQGQWDNLRRVYQQMKKWVDEEYRK